MLSQLESLHGSSSSVGCARNKGLTLDCDVARAYGIGVGTIRARTGQPLTIVTSATQPPLLGRVMSMGGEAGP